MKKTTKLISSVGLATILMAGAAQVSFAQMDEATASTIKQEIELKQEYIANNPYIPQYKKDIINSKLELKKDIIDSKVGEEDYVYEEDVEEIEEVEDVDVDDAEEAEDIDTEDEEEMEDLEDFEDIDEEEVEDMDIEGIKYAIQSIELKQEYIANNPYMPQYKKDIINRQLEAKKAILEAKLAI